MDRRTLLRRTALLGAIGLAGCTDGGSSPGGGGDDTPADGDDPTTEPPTTEPPATGDVDGVDFQVVDVDNTGEPGADVTFDADTNEVRITGTITGSDGCKTAALEAVEHDSGADEVTLAVITKDRPDAGDACTQALVYIDYEVTVTFTGGLPSKASVTHDGRGVTSGATDSGSGSDY